MLPLINPNSKVLKLGLFVPLIWTIASFTTQPHFSDLTETLLLGTGVSYACDLLFIAATRWLLRWSSSMRHFAEIVGVILLNMLLAAVLTIVPYRLYQLSLDFFWTPDSSGLVFAAPFGDWKSSLGRVLAYFFSLVTAANIIDGMVASAFMLLALSMLAHRLFWPLINRPLYALRERGVRRGVFALVGLALLAYAGLDVGELGAAHHNPSYDTVGDTQKHRWNEVTKAKEAYIPPDITASVEDPLAVWAQFCAEARINHNGVLNSPPTAPGGLVF
jgi:hypothetical protein